MNELIADCKHSIVKIMKTEKLNTLVFTGKGNCESSFYNENTSLMNKTLRSKPKERDCMQQRLRQQISFGYKN